MLEAIRQNSRSTIIYVLFGVLIAVFIINFGPGSGVGGGAVSDADAVRVAGSKVSEQDFQVLYRIFGLVVTRGRGDLPAQAARENKFKELVMDKLIERELLAQEAEKLGFSVSDKEVEDMLATGRISFLGGQQDIGGWVVDGAFDYKRFQNFVENRLGVNVQHFIDLQRRELLAEKVRQSLTGGTKVTPEEVKADYVQRETQSDLEFVRFQPRHYEAEVAVSPEEITDYRARHADEIKKHYEDRSFLYKNVERSLRARLILVEIKKDKDTDEAAATAAAEKRAAKIKAQLDGKKDFAAVARESSDDASTKARGGDLGWRKAGLTGFSKELEEKAFKAKPGEVVGPDKTERGFEIVLVEKFRQGDVSLDEVAPEIAEDKLRTEKAKALAKAAADAALKAHTADKTLAAEFPKGDEPGKAPSTAPAAEETGPFQRGGERVNAIGISAGIMKAAFTLKTGETGGPYEVDDTWVIIRVKERKEPDMKAFEEKKDEKSRELERSKWIEVVNGFVKARCVEARDAKRISPNPAVLSYEGGDEPAAPTSYVPCGNRL